MRGVAVGVMLLSIGAAGCSHTTEVADPSAITLNAALIDVADSLNDVRQRTKDREKFGLLVDEVTVEFNVSSKATSSNKLAVSAANVPIPSIGGVLGLSSDSTLQSEANRGNKIVVKFKNVATADFSKGNDRCKQNPIPPDCVVLFRNNLPAN